MPELWLALIIVGFLAGILSGLFGIGGGVVIVPTLILMLGFSTSQATSTSLAALMLPVGIFAVLTYYNNGLMDVRGAVLIAVGLAITSAVGARITLYIEDFNPQLMKQIYGVFLLQSGWRLAEPRKLYRQWQNRKSTVNVPPLAEVPTPQASLLTLFGVGLVAGIFSGMFGIGGGIVIVPILTMLLGYEQKRATGTSLGALLMPVGLPGVLVYARDGVLEWAVGALVAVGLVFGAVVGAKIAMNLSSVQIKRAYGVFLMLVGLNFILL